MKNIIKSGFFALLTLLMVTACDPQESSEYTLGNTPSITPESILIAQQVSDTSNNIITFQNLSDIDVPYALIWDLGNGSTSKSNSVTAQYPFAGEYTVSLTIYTADGSSNSKSLVVTIANNDYALINTPVYKNLTGGSENADGKTWVFDQYNNYAKEVATATGLAISGHLGLGEQGSYGQGWWAAGANEKGDLLMYNNKFTFIQTGVQLKIENAGKGYGRNASAASVGGFNVTDVTGDDATFDYNGGNYNFSIDESGTYPKLTLTGNAFLGYYCGTQDYDIIYQTDQVMALRVNNTVESQDWVFVYCLEELNIGTPPKENEANPLAEDFEQEMSVNFSPEDLGEMTGITDNPAPFGNNTSSKVYRYQKNSAFYGNLAFTASTYKFDLATQNKIKVKVFIPSYNDYTTENSVAGDWISNNKLRPQLAVKLQDSSKGGSAWETQVEIVKGDLEKDKWIELEFDFSTAKDRLDFDTIILQFGAEGQSGEGFFYFDDFSFDQ